MVASTLLLTVKYKHSKGIVYINFRFVITFTNTKLLLVLALNPYYTYTLLVAVIIYQKNSSFSEQLKSKLKLT